LRGRGQAHVKSDLCAAQWKTLCPAPSTADPKELLRPEPPSAVMGLRPERQWPTNLKMSPAAFVVDAYGTLFDVHAAVRRHAAAIGPEGQLLSEIWRAKQLEYSWVRSLMGSYADFWQLTEQALDFAFDKVPSADRTLRADILDAYWRLDCY